MIDWNGNGRHDLTDDFIGYQVYRKTEKEKPGCASSWLGWLLGLGLLIAAIILF